MPQSSSSLLALDPELGVLLSAEALAAARRQLVVAVIELPVGPWQAASLQAANPANPGLLLLSGVLAREVMVRRTISTELLGPGDLVRPWQLERMPPLLELKVAWQVLDPVKAAVLDCRLAQRLNGYPEIRAVLIDRLNERAERLAVMRAIAQMTGVEARLETLLWHLADR